MHLLFGILILLVPLEVVGQQQELRTDTLDLLTVRQMAVFRDPRSIQPQLLVDASQLKQENIRAQRLPQIAVSAQATLQNEVPTINLAGMGSAGPPLDQYRVQAEVDWLIYGGGRLRKEAIVEETRLSENLAGVSHVLQSLREGATETFFAALLFQAKTDALSLAVEDLSARLQLVRTQVQDSVALQADAAAIEAELIQLRQQVEEADGNRLAALAVLSGLLDHEVPAETILALPKLSTYVASVVTPGKVAGESELESIDTPALERLLMQQKRLSAESSVAGTRMLPQVSLFGQAGLGRPGPFNFLSNNVNEFGLAGIRLRWSVLDWGQTRRRTRLFQQQASIAASELDATRRTIARNVQDDQTTIQRLTRALDEDVHVVSLREQVLEVAGYQLEEGVLLPAQYADRVTDLAGARLTLARHRIELALAEARLLSALGHFPDKPDPRSSTLKGLIDE